MVVTGECGGSRVQFVRDLTSTSLVYDYLVEWPVDFFCFVTIKIRLSIEYDSWGTTVQIM